MTEQTLLTPEILVPKIGNMLVERGLITADQLSQAVDRQRQLRSQGHEMPIGAVLVDLGHINRQVLDKTITEHSLALRAALEAANRNLERRVEERTAELQLALQKLAELNQLKANFISNISHELRTPLTHIKGYLDLLVSQDLGPTTSEQEKAMGVMQRSSERLEHLIEDLILFSTTERGEVTLHVVRFNLSELCRGILQKAQSKAAVRRIVPELKAGETDFYVDADGEKIGWVITQILDNAIKFSPPEHPVWIALEQESNLVRISINDQGIGIPSDRLEEIFEPFHQLDGSSTRKFGGTGLGLALVRKIIEAHGTMVHVTSQVGIGSVFDFVLRRSKI